MTNEEAKREKTFSEELPYFKERMKEISDNYDNPDGEVSNNLETKLKAEAIREFADRLKGMKYESIEWAHGEHPYVVEESDIDNLVEEMTGDK